MGAEACHFAVTQREDHCPHVFDETTGRFDAAVIMTYGHDLIALGDELIRLKFLLAVAGGHHDRVVMQELPLCTTSDRPPFFSPL
jgi:hypothetical protein